MIKPLFKMLHQNRGKSRGLAKKGSCHQKPAAKKAASRGKAGQRQSRRQQSRQLTRRPRSGKRHAQTRDTEGLLQHQKQSAEPV